MNQITYEQRVQIYKVAIGRYGRDKQMIVALEEMSEIQKEICKALRGKGNLDHLAEEVADATIMLEQLRMMYFINETVCRKMDEKVKRLAGNLGVELPNMKDGKLEAHDVANDLLTLDELQQMDKQPIWVEPILEKYNNSELSGYCVVYGDEAMVPGIEYWSWQFKTYGKEWIAYRRKPEKDK